MKKLLGMLCIATLVLGAISSASALTLFEDNFNDGVLDESIWTRRAATGSGPNCPNGSPVGSYVQETSGMLRVVQNQTDCGGAVGSSPIAINPTGLLTLTLRSKTHYANQYYRGGIGMGQLEDGSYLGGLASIAHYNYAPFNDYGFGDPQSMYYDGSAFFEPIWDEWVTEVLVYNPVTAETTYSLNGAPPIQYEYPYTLTGTAVDLRISSYGWGTGHYMEVDFISLEQEGAPVPEPSTVLLLAFGLGVIGFQGIRKSRR